MKKVLLFSLLLLCLIFTSCFTTSYVEVPSIKKEVIVEGADKIQLNLRTDVWCAENRIEKTELIYHYPGVNPDVLVLRFNYQSNDESLDTDSANILMTVEILDEKVVMNFRIDGVVPDYTLEDCKILLKELVDSYTYVLENGIIVL